MSVSHARRSFISTVASLAGLAATGVSASQRPPGQSDPASGGFDMAWLDQMTGKHKQLYDLGGLDLAVEPRPLRFARNYFDTFRDVFHLTYPDINIAIGISGPALPMNVSDAAWAKYKLGERTKTIDPMTKQPAVRNVLYDDGSDTSVKALQARGAVFWQCNVALGAVSQQLATLFQMPVAEVRADLLAALNPGVRLMPSHVMALGLAQERGFTYMKP